MADEKYYYISYNSGSGGNWVAYLIGQHSNFNKTTYEIESESYLLGGVMAVSILEDFMQNVKPHHVKNIHDLKLEYSKIYKDSITPSKWIFRGTINDHSLQRFILHVDKIKNAVNDKIGKTRYINLVVEEKNHYALVNRGIHLSRIGKVPSVESSMLNKATKGMNDILKVSADHGLDAHGIDSIELIKGSVAEYNRLCEIIDTEPNYDMFNRESYVYRNAIWKDFL